MDITRTCPLTQKTNTMVMDVTPEQISRWEAGELIQDVMPDLTRDEREFIKSGVTPETWKEMFG